MNTRLLARRIAITGFVKLFLPLIFALIFLIIPVSAKAATIIVTVDVTWVGGTGVWSDPSGWSPTIPADHSSYIPTYPRNGVPTWTDGGNTYVTHCISSKKLL